MWLPKTKNLKHGIKLTTTTHEGTHTHRTVSAAPAVDVESILQGECERTVRDVGVGSEKTGTLAGTYTLVTVTVCGQTHTCFCCL